MYITDVVLEKNVLKQIQQKLVTSVIFMVLFALNILVSIAFVVFAFIKQIGELNSYLFGAFGILIPVFWFVVAINEYKTYKMAKQQILEHGNFVLQKPTEVNAEHKYNSSTILNIICAILVFVCFVAALVVQIIDFDVTSLYTVVMLFVLTVFMFYQMIISLVNDKMFRIVIFNSENNN